MNENTRISLTQYVIDSDILANSRNLWLQPPADESAAETLAVFLDGEFFVGFFDAPAAMARLQREGVLPPTWSVYIAGGDRTRRWPESFCNPDFAHFICDELLPEIASKTGPSTERLLAGVSLTGLSAAHVALTHPGVFSRVLCLSGSFWWEQAQLASEIAAMPRHETAFRLTVGDQETSTDVEHGHGLVQELSQIEGVRRMHEALEAHGFPVQYAEYEGGHDAVSWRRELPGDLRALWAMTNKAS